VAHWLYLLHPPRTTFADDMTDVEADAMSRHYVRLRDDSRVVLAGPVTDCTAPGIVVFEAEDETEARDFMDGDPAVREGVVTATLHPFRLSLLKP